MNLRALPSSSMIAISHELLNNQELRGELAAHPLGAAACANLHDAHELLAQRHQLHDRLVNDIARLSKLLESLDFDFDRLTRAMDCHLDGLIEGTNNPMLADRYRRHKEILLPEGVRVTRFSYMDEAGTTLAVERCVTPEILGQLDGIQVGDHTMGSLYRACNKAGRAIGEKVQERTRLQASLTREGTISARAGAVKSRSRWIRAMQLLLGVADELPLSDSAREKLLAPIEKSIADALARRAESPGDMPEEDEADDVDEPGAEPADESDLAMLDDVERTMELDATMMLATSGVRTAAAHRE